MVSPAMQALYVGDTDRANELLPPDDELSVFEAAAFGKVDRLRELLDEDPAQVGVFSDDGFTPLHLAIFGGQAGSVGLLIERGADLEALSTASIARVRPLGTAAFVHSTELAGLLLDAGADPNGAEEGGSTPLDAALQNGDTELAELLRARGAGKPAP
jgi:ankyrin repeat protein